MLKLVPGFHLVVLSDEVELLVGLLQKEDDVRKDDHRHQLDFTPGVVQVGDALKPNWHNQRILSSVSSLGDARIVFFSFNYMRRLLLESRSDFLNFLFL